MTHSPQGVRAWVRLYTYGLPAAVTAAREAEIESDVYEHLLSEQMRLGRHVRLSVLGRAVRGAADDLGWRREERLLMKQQSVRRPTVLGSAREALTQAWFAPAAALLALIYLAIAAWIVVEPEGKRPGRVVGPILFSLFACCLVAGLRMRRSERAPAESAGAAARAPRGRRASAADVLLVVGTVPGLALMWMIIPAVLGLTVIAGVISDRTASRRTSAA